MPSFCKTRLCDRLIRQEPLGDRNEYLPTVHGFDVYGILYHPNAEEQPELPDYPKDPTIRAKFGSKSHSYAFFDSRVVLLGWAQ